MGTDIHMYIERRDPGSTEWRRVDCETWDDRSYVTFAVLANVRNGYGFAGANAANKAAVAKKRAALAKKRKRS